MATNFRNIIGKEIGTQRVAVSHNVRLTSTTIIGLNIANLTDSMVNCTMELEMKQVTLDSIRNMPVSTQNTAMKPHW